MNISSSTTQNTQYTKTESKSVIKNLYTEKLTKDEAKELKQAVVDNANTFTFKSVETQTATLSIKEKFEKDYNDFQSFLKDIGYNGSPIAELSQDEAAKLVSEDGIFGVKQTSQRIADFVINGANKDESLLRAGREGMLAGFKAAQEAWGEKLPEISQKTMQAATELVDKTMHNLGYSILNQEA